MRYTKTTLGYLEDILQTGGYLVRYEQGNFRSGACLVNGANVIIVNKHFTLEGKINSLTEILKDIEQKNSFFASLSEKQIPYFKVFIQHEPE